MSFLKDRVQDEDVTKLIEEQRQKESTKVYRRGWCVSEATCLDDANEQNVIRIAKKIYDYVYGDESP